jgi:hypothetical protein
LIHIGAFSPGSSKRIDGSIALIDRIQNFLIQPIRQRCTFAQTVKQLQEIADSWDQLLSEKPAAETMKKKAKPKALP